MDLFQNEEAILTANGEQLLLTSHRIEYSEKDWGSKISQCFFLENISVIEMNYTSSIIALLLAVIAAVFAAITAVSGGNDTVNQILRVSILVAIISAVWWFFSRKHVIRIISQDGTKMNIRLDNIGRDQVDHFLFELKKAKTNRHLSLFSIS